MGMGLLSPGCCNCGARPPAYLVLGVLGCYGGTTMPPGTTVTLYRNGSVYATYSSYSGPITVLAPPPGTYDITVSVPSPRYVAGYTSPPVTITATGEGRYSLGVQAIAAAGYLCLPGDFYGGTCNYPVSKTCTFLDSTGTYNLTWQASTGFTGGSYPMPDGVWLSAPPMLDVYGNGCGNVKGFFYSSGQWEAILYGCYGGGVFTTPSIYPLEHWTCPASYPSANTLDSEATGTGYGSVVITEVLP